jgi:hypothetical protein
MSYLKRGYFTMASKSLNKILAASSLTLLLSFNGAADAASSGTEPRIGAKMADGTVYAGISEETRTALYAAPANAPALHKWEKAVEFCRASDVSGHKDWRLPSENELNTLYMNKGKGALKGTFTIAGSNPPGFYWSATLFSWPVDDRGVKFARGQQFDHSGERYAGFQDHPSSVRCVRTEKPPRL